MRGKILFFNEEKGFGKIIDSEKKDYFFYINKIKNKPELINKDDEVEFEYYESPKGLRAENISFIVKIKCPVCGYINLESEKNCKNEKCKFELTYVKDGAFIGLSSTDIEKYNQELIKKREIYKSSIIQNKDSIKIIKPKESKFNRIVLKNINITQNLEDLKRTQFENEIEYKNRIDGLDYFLIGDVKLENYVRDDEYFNLTCYFSDKFIGNIEYACNFNAKVYIPVSIAKDFFSRNYKYSLLGKVSIIEGKVTLVDVCVSSNTYDYYGRNISSTDYHYSFKKHLNDGVILEIKKIIANKQKEIKEYESQKNNIHPSETFLFIFSSYNKYEQSQVDDLNKKIKKLENEISSLENEVLFLIEEKNKLNS